MKLARTISIETGADAGILEHAMRLLDLTPTQRLAQGLAMGRMGHNLRVVER
jgi:hypothetical protein